MEALREECEGGVYLYMTQCKKRLHAMRTAASAQ